MAISARPLFDIHVHPSGTDAPGFGSEPGSGAVLTPNYGQQIAACNAPAGARVRMIIDSAFGPDNPCPGFNLMNTPASCNDWSQGTNLVTGGLGGRPIDVAIWGLATPGPVIAGNVCVSAVAVDTVWCVQAMQLESVAVDLNADRGGRINFGWLAHGSFAEPGSSSYRVNANYQGSIECFGGNIVNGGGTYFWRVALGGLITAHPLALTPPAFAPGAGYAATSWTDPTSILNLPIGWPGGPGPG